MAFPPQFLDELRVRLALSDVVGKRMRLIRAGREYKSPCPFHNEKTPSFYVNDQKGFFHCLAAETGVILRDGVRPIGTLAGTTQTILTRGGVWVPAVFKSYGVQKLHRITLSRNGLSKTVHATGGHRWFVRGVKGDVLTTGLRPGHRLDAVLPEARQDWTLDPAGVAHGIVFGDGSVDKGHYGHVHLHGEKDRVLAGWFPDHTPVSRLTESGKPYLRIYGGKAFGHMKGLPSLDGASDAYLLGFLAGYLAADGHVAKDGTVMLHSAKRENLEWVRAAALRVGIVTYGITTATRQGLASVDCDISRVHFVTSTMNAALFLGDTARQRFEAAEKSFDRLRWVVQSVEETDREEEVYCAEVPGEHAFAIEDNILTGNCFGCGAHGDIISFVMRHDNLAFPEAVEALASEAGLTVPQATPEDRQRYERRKTLGDLVEETCRWFEQQLHGRAGRAGMEYLLGRGLDAESIARFRLGYAPADGAALRQHLLKQGHAEEDMVSAGVTRWPDGGGPSRSFFRNRVMFPVTDRRGQVVAFGGRILEGDGPKYINTADTPLFQKGTLLYGLSRARQAAADGQPVLVAEGYMDVIALVRAGFEGAVAPLGTALTETQVQALWKLLPGAEKEPFLCFDGDNAGRRAAWRAVERILPHLAPGHTARVAFMPEGEDPDSLIRVQGPRAMQAVLDAAIPLSEAVWRMETEGRNTDTPEAKAAVKAALEARVAEIANRDVQSFYLTEMRRRVSEAFAPPPRQRTPWQPQWQPGMRRGDPPRRHVPGLPGMRTAPPAGHRRRSPGHLFQARERLLLAVLVNHPDLFDELGEPLGLVPFADPHMDDLRGAVLEALGGGAMAARSGGNGAETGRQGAVNAPREDSGLDAVALCRHLSSAGFDTIVGSLLSESTYVHGSFARPDASREEAREGWWQTWQHLHHRQVMAELREAEAALARDNSEANFARVLALRQEVIKSGTGMTDEDDLDDA
ncbi:DNA primase [Azospirillum sp. SYSU D00513]|uniref:DNA primase n=1 Tax=Azospirillum sp. SYSU D00513 TaxID=2812561 RepID=UPI001A95EB15|nr:DNA primase [Azospirillum sp. SYSU D00513]